MNKNSIVLFFISALLILLVGLGSLSAESLENNQISVDDSMINVGSDNQEQSDLIKVEKQTFTNNVKEASSASSYAELKSYVDDATDAETEIILEEKTYEVDEPIVWGTSETAKTLTIEGNGATIDGTGNYQFITVNEGYTLNLNNLIIQNTVAEKGSAILNYGTLNINNVTFKGNIAKKTGNIAAGAAIYSEGTTSVKDSTFKNNRIIDGINGDDGAAICTKGPLYVYNSIFDSNIGEYTDTSSSSNGANGGAIGVIDSTSDFIVNNSTFTNNKGRHGGAINIFDEQGRNQGTKKITNSTFTGNQAIYGGAIEVYNDLIIEDSVFNDNFVYGVGSSNFNPRGGAICVNNLTQTGILSLTIRNTSFERNTAPQTAISGSTLVGYGGAIDSAASETLIENCTFIANSANKGGAYYCQESNRNRVLHATINDTTFKSNVAMDGAAIFDQHNGNVGTDSLTIDQSVFEENVPTSTAYYGISLNYDDLTIINTEITGVRPIKVSTSQRSSKYGNNVTVNGLHNVTGIFVNNPVVSPTNYEELVLVSKEINNEYTGVELVYINLVGTKYTETEPIVFDDMPCNLIINGSSKKIDANGKQFLTIGEGKTVTLRNMTIANAKAESGAAIINYGSLNTQNNVIFDNNEALYYGGAIYSTGNLSVSTTNFTNNKVTTITDATLNDYGGAAICSLGKLTVQRSNFVENVAAHDVSPDGDGGSGGAINILNTTQDVSITASNFTKNDACNGGAIRIDNNGNENTKKITIDNNKFDENTALYGAAINTYQQVNITNSKFENNDAKVLGDLVYTLNDVTIKDSTISSDNLEKIIGGNGNIIATNNVVNDETLPERLIKTSITVTPITHLNLDEDNLINATLIDATNVPVVGKEVNVLINGEVIDTGETDENGIVSYNYKPTEGTTATIQFTFTPDDYYIASESEEIEVDLVSREDTVIEYVIVNDVEGKVVVDIRVYEKESEDLIVNARVDLTGDVEATGVRTNKLYQNTELEAGEHTITATYNGLDYYYKPCTTDITLTVIEDPSALITELNETIENQASQISDLNDTINDQASQISDLNDTINDQASQISDLNDTINDLNDALDEANDKIDD
ncbi:hypothetical protein, partial [Methanosphaera sp.]|uniref:hypothetical protein n=1 Tax=Methanosphaera sp. TaxID=2666342 RepID=UPI0025FFD928